MPTNIPTRTPSPIKANSAIPGPSSAATSGKAPQKAQLDAKEPTRLEPGPAPLRATSDASARLASDPSKPRYSRVATNTSTINAAACGGRLVPGHSRSQSSSNASLTRPASIAPERPKGAIATASSRSQHAISTQSPGDTRLPVARSHNRALSALVRPRPNADTGLLREAVPEAKRPIAPHVISGGNATSSSGRPIVKQGRKPEFDVRQQHYSPKKQAPVSTAVSQLSSLDPGHFALRSGSAGRVTPGTEVAHLDDELLQLSLVHEQSAATFQHYEASIKSQLKAGFEGVEHQLSTLTSLRHDRQAKINTLAVSRWLDQERARQDVDHAGSDALLLLARCLEELQKVSGVHGPLETAMKMFDEWCVLASSRRPINGGDNLFHGGNSEEKAHCLHPMDPQWSALVSSVYNRVNACVSLLGGLQRPPEWSSIGSLMEMHLTLAEQMLQEIFICRTIEGLILREQQEWLAREVKQALADAELHHSIGGARDITRMGIWDQRGKAS